MNGEDGDAFFKGVSIANGFVVFTLNDKESTEIKIPFYSETELTVHVTEPGTLKSLLTDEQMRTVISLKVIGSINGGDIRTIDASMLVVERVDLSDTDITGAGSFSGYGLLYGNQTLKEIIYPESCTDIAANAFKGCTNLETVSFGQNSKLQTIGDGAFARCTSLKEIEIPASVTLLYLSAFSVCDNLKTIICHATLPPQLNSISGTVPANCVLYVPNEAVALYKAAGGWKSFKTILPIPE